MVNHLHQKNTRVQPEALELYSARLCSGLQAGICSDVNKDWTCKDNDKDQAYKDQDKD